MYVETAIFDLINTEDSNTYIIDSSSGYIPLPGERGRGFCPFTLASGIFGNCAYDSNITVHDSMGVVSPSEYSVNFVNASITMSSGAIPVEIVAPWYYVSVVERWPEGDIPSLPLVVLSSNEYKAEGYQLGGGKKPVMKCEIYIFASSASELDDLSNRIFNRLYNRSVGLYNFDNGDMFNADGTYNYDFDCSVSINPSVLYFEDVSIKHKILKLYDSGDINMYRASILFNVFAYIEPE